LKKYIFPILIFLSISLIYSYKLFSSFNFHPDFARDIYDMLTIIRGKLTLIGPKFSFGGIYSGPYYYYLFVPIFYLTKLNIDSLLIFNLLIFIAALLVYFIYASKKFDLISAILAVLVLTFIPIYLIFSRSPWNGSTYLPLLLIFLTLLYFQNFKSIGLFLLGIWGGAIITIHLVNLPILIIAFLYFLKFNHNRYRLIYLALGVLVALLPLIAFEFRHNFIMLKNTFIIGSYQSFIENKNIPYAVSGNKNFLKNIFFVGKHLSSQTGVNILIYFSLFILLWPRLKETRLKFFIMSILVLFLIYSLILRYQFGQHYLFPFSLFIVFIAIITLLNTKNKWLLVVVLLLELSSFPKTIYNTSPRKSEKYEKAVNFIIDNKIVQKNDSFNIIQYSKEYKIYVPIGHEYRFFFVKNKFLPKSEFEYNTSGILLIFSELNDLDITKLNSWEIDQFGKQYFNKRQKYKIGDIILYKIKKI